MKRREFFGTMYLVCSLPLTPAIEKLSRASNPTTESILSAQALRSILVELLPKANFIANDMYETLLPELVQYNIQTQDQLERMIRNNLRNVLELDRSLVLNRMLRDHLADHTGTPSDKFQAFLSHVGMVRSILQSGNHQ